MRHRTIVLFMVLALVVAACTDDEADTTTTAAPAETPVTTAPADTTDTAPDTTMPPETTQPEDVAAEHECFYVTGLIAAPLDSGLEDDRIQLLEGGDIDTAISNLALSEEVLGPGEASLDLGTSIALMADIFRITDDSVPSDPLALANELRNATGIAVAPIHGVTVAVHWAMLPGEDPDGSVSGGLLNDMEPGDDPSTWIGIVDTPVVSTGFSWIDDSVEQAATTGDTALDPSHGTFVASLIRQVSPSTGVVWASADLVKPEETLNSEGGNFTGLGANQPDAISSELHVAQAIQALINSGTSFDALNLSLGTYACPLVPLNGESPVPLLEGALIRWADPDENQSSGAPVFAAAGNEDLESPLWPAALTTVQSGGLLPAIEAIDALDLNGERVVWEQVLDGQGDVVEPRTSRLALPTNNTGHDWATGAAPGIDLIGVGGPDAVYRWSGSSFASPIAAAMFVQGTWQGGTVAHPEVVGLHYFDQGTAKRVEDQAGNVVDIP